MYPRSGLWYQETSTKTTLFRDAETTILIKFAFWSRLGRGKIYGKLPKNAVFLGNSMTIKFGNFANFIVKNVFVIWEAPTFGNHPFANPPKSIRVRGRRHTPKFKLFHALWSLRHLASALTHCPKRDVSVRRDASQLPPSLGWCSPGSPCFRVSLELKIH